MSKESSPRSRKDKALPTDDIDLLSIVFHTTDNIYILMDVDFRILYYNQRAADFTKKELNHETMSGDFLFDYISKERKADVVANLKKGLTSKLVSYEVRYKHDDGTVSWYHIRIFPVIRKKIAEGVLLVGSDITEKKGLEEKLLNGKIEEQKRILRAVLHAQEVERNKFGQELHDNINQILFIIRLYAQMLGSREESPELVDRIRELIDLAISEIRELSKENVTPQRKFDLKELIASLLKELNLSAQNKTRFYCRIISSPQIDEDLKLNIYRIVQEQIHNILKYAAATRATVTMSEKNGSLRLLITDNGKGFDPIRKVKGIGIANIANRVASFNGSLHIVTAPGRGCRMEILIPLQ